MGYLSSGPRLLLLNTDLLRGGTPTVVRELAVRLRRAGVDVEVACLSTWGPVADELRDAGVPVTALDATSRDVTVLTRLTRLIRDRRYTTVLSFLMHANAAAAVASLRVGRGVRWVQSIQTTQPDPWWHWPVQRAAQHAADAVVVPSPSAAQVAMAWAGVPADRLVVIPNAIDPADWPPTTGARPADVVFLGRLDPVKDVPTLVAAVGLLTDRAGACRPGPGRPGPADHCRTCTSTATGPTGPASSGPLPTVDCTITSPSTARSPALRPRWRRRACWFCRRWPRGFGLVLIEAMAAGVPVVATDVSGVRDVVRNGETGLLVPPGDAAALAAVIRRMIDDRSLRDRLVSAAAEDVRRRFTWDAVLLRYRDFCRFEAVGRMRKPRMYMRGSAGRKNA